MAGNVGKTVFGVVGTTDVGAIVVGLVINVEDGTTIGCTVNVGVVLHDVERFVGRRDDFFIQHPMSQ